MVREKPKIAYDTLIQKIKLGGLKLVDFETRVKALYVQWVRRLSTNLGCMGEEVVKHAYEWNYSLFRFFQSKTKKKIDYTEAYTCNFRMLEVWQEVHSYYPIDASHIKCESIWNNCLLRMLSVLYL